MADPFRVITVLQKWKLAEVEATYCHQDTLVLAMCWGEYRRTAIMDNSVDPNSCVTIASYCMKVYRNAFVPIEGIPTLSVRAADAARKALKGGRTEMFVNKMDTTELNEPDDPDPYIINGLDVQSMYPTVQAFDEMPYGEPEEFQGDELPPLEEWILWCGIVCCDVIPPPFDPERPFFKPVIGATSVTGKFEFNLDRKDGHHACIVELREAVRVGYKVENVRFVHKYEDRRDLFKDYIYHCLKRKVESSDPPPAHELEGFLQAHRDRYGIELDGEEVMRPINPGVRALFKMELNSLWGKMCQREQDTTELVEPEGYHKLQKRHIDGEVRITGVTVDPYLPHTFAVAYKELKRPTDMVRKKTNTAIGAHVAAGGRLRLYKVLGDPTLEGHVLYCDTDSVYFTCRKSYKHELEGRYLGDWESECTPGVDFTMGVFIAPKVYCIWDPKQPGHKATKLKVKGFRLSMTARGIVTPNALLGMLEPDEEGDHPTLSVPDRCFRRQRYGGVFVGKTQKVLAYNPTTLKSYAPDDGNGFFIPFGPHTTRPEPQPTKRPWFPPPEPLPPVKHARVEEGWDKDDDDDTELTDAGALALMAEQIALQDGSRGVSTLAELVQCYADMEEDSD